MRTTIKNALRDALPTVDDLAVSAAYSVIAGVAYGTAAIVEPMAPKLGLAGYIAAAVFLMWAVQPLIANGIRRAVQSAVYDFRVRIGKPPPPPAPPLWRQRQIEAQKAAKAEQERQAA